MEVKVVSKEMIKPCFQTQQHLRSYQLSFLDQISPPVYCPFLLFYSLKGTEFESNPNMISLKLKKSLSDVLILFYPLAGRVKGNLLVDCNDEGVPFSVARVNRKLSDVIDTPNPSELNKLIPFPLDDAARELALGVQINHFECGGVAIACFVTHKIADALSSFTFLKSWAASTAQKVLIPPPEFISASLFPPKNISGYDPGARIIDSQKISRVVTRRFLFKNSAIESIRAKYGKGLEDQRRASRVEALSAFIWNRFLSATKRGQDGRLYVMVHAVNLRTRTDPPLSEFSFGNLYRNTITTLSSDGDDEEGFCGLVKKMREQISSFDKEYVKDLQQGNEHLTHIKKRSQEVLNSEMVYLAFTSLCSFGVYDCDFGWGKPARVVVPPMPFNNVVLLINSESGDAIEAYINLDEADMARFQRDEKLLAFVSFTDVEAKMMSKM